MKQVFLAGALVAALGMAASPLHAQRSQQQSAAKAGTSLGTVTLKNKVNADGQMLAPGTYQVRLTDERPSPAVGESPDSERYVEFVRGGKVVAKTLATVIPQSDIAQVAKGPKPPTGGSRVDVLKGDQYVRVWINKGGSNYLIHLPKAV
jgi:hypothetical protein